MMKQPRNFNITRGLAVVALALAMSIAAVGCGQTEREQQEGDTLRVVTTTTMLWDLVSVIGGDRVDCTGLMGAGIDPHLYQASAGDVAKLEGADVVVYNGLHLEGAMNEVFQQLEGTGQYVICLGDGLDEESLLTTEDEVAITYDPHIWFDVSLWMEGATYVAGCLAEADPQYAEGYQENLRHYLEELERLEEYMFTAIEEIAPDQRVLITAHDAFGYFGRAYGLEVMGLQGISTQSEASTADVSQLATLIAQRQVKAIFVETSISTKNIEALQEAVAAQGFDVAIGGELYSDSLGDASTGHDSYIATVMANVDTIVEGLK